MLGNVLEFIGIFLTVAGLIRDERLAKWEKGIRAFIGRAADLTWARKILTLAGRWSTHLRNAIFHNEALIAAFAVVVFMIAGIGSFCVNSYSEGQLQLTLHEAQQQDPAGYDRTMLIMLVFMAALIGILLISDKIGAFLRKYLPFVFRLLAFIGKAIRWLAKAYVYVTFSVIFGVVAIVLLSPLILLLLGGFVVVIVVVSFLTVGFLIVRLALFPYQLLDLLAVKLDLKSTVMMIGWICAIAGWLIKNVIDQ